MFGFKRSNKQVSLPDAATPASIEAAASTSQTATLEVVQVNEQPSYDEQLNRWLQQAVDKAEQEQVARGQRFEFTLHKIPSNAQYLNDLFMDLTDRSPAYGLEFICFMGQTIIFRRLA